MIYELLVDSSLHHSFDKVEWGLYPDPCASRDTRTHSYDFLLTCRIQRIQAILSSMSSTGQNGRLDMVRRYLEADFVSQMNLSCRIGGSFNFKTSLVHTFLQKSVYYILRNLFLVDSSLTSILGPSFGNN